MPTVALSLHISPEKFLEWYRGSARNVFARTDAGQTIQFPASVLQQFVTAEGIHGDFLLTYDAQQKFVSIEKIDRPGGFERLA